MVALSAFTAHKPPVRNRELVTEPNYSKERALELLPPLLLSPMDSLPRMITPNLTVVQHCDPPLLQLPSTTPTISRGKTRH